MDIFSACYAVVPDGRTARWEQRFAKLKLEQEDYQSSAAYALGAEEQPLDPMNIQFKLEESFGPHAMAILGQSEADQTRELRETARQLFTWKPWVAPHVMTSPDWITFCRSVAINHRARNEQDVGLGPAVYRQILQLGDKANIEWVISNPTAGQDANRLYAQDVGTMGSEMNFSLDDIHQYLLSTPKCKQVFVTQRPVRTRKTHRHGNKRRNGETSSRIMTTTNPPKPEPQHRLPPNTSWET